MDQIQQRPACEAGRLGTASRFVLGGPQDITNPFRSSLDRLPLSIRLKYQANCLAGDTAYRHIAEARRLLQETQP